MWKFLVPIWMEICVVNHTLCDDVLYIMMKSTHDTLPVGVLECCIPIVHQIICEQASFALLKKKVSRKNTSLQKFKVCQILFVNPKKSSVTYDTFEAFFSFSPRIELNSSRAGLNPHTSSYTSQSIVHQGTAAATENNWIKQGEWSVCSLVSQLLCALATILSKTKHIQPCFPIDVLCV